MDIELARTDSVFILDMGEGENRFNDVSLAALNDALTEVEQVAANEAVALVTTGSGKYFSNGIDLDWMMNDGPKDVEAFLASMMRFWARIMALPIPTVAAVNGHAFAGGAMFSLAHDHVFMRSGRGYWCVNEVLLQMPFAPGMLALLTSRLPASTARKAMLTAHRFDAAEAIGAGIADAAYPVDDLRSAAVSHAQALAPTANPTLGRIKEDLFASPLEALRLGAMP